MSTCTCNPATFRRTGQHHPNCPDYRMNTLGLVHEFRAVFSYPGSILGPTPDTYGPWRSTLQEAAKDRVPRSEETLGHRSGFQRRLVGPLEPQPVMVELDSVPMLQDTTDEGMRQVLRGLHGRWLDAHGSTRESLPGDTPAIFTTVRTGQIVYREDGQPAEVHTLRRDWNQR